MPMTEQDVIRAIAWRFLPKTIQDLATDMCTAAGQQLTTSGFELAIGDDVLIFRSAVCDYLHACIRATSDREARKKMD